MNQLGPEALNQIVSNGAIFFAQIFWTELLGAQ